MSIADRLVSEFMPIWMRRHKDQPVALSPKPKKTTRRQSLTPRPTVAFKPKPVNPERYSTHL